MKTGTAALRFAAVSTGLALSACALWFVPESRSRGHIFDDAVRGQTVLTDRDGRERLERVIHTRFPPGTPVDDVVGHIEAAGGVCSTDQRIETKPGRSSLICTYASSNYFATALMGMGEPDYRLAENSWTVIVGHSDGVVRRYTIDGAVDLHVLDRDDYLDGLDQQRAEEQAVRAPN